MNHPPPRPGFRWAWIVTAVVLAVVVVAQGVARWRPESPGRPPHLSGRFASPPDGWSMQEVPLGPTEFLSNEAEKVLRYDDVINREYRRDGQSFTLYVAYWSPGKMPTQLVASHTPDRCWTENGWQCREMRFKQMDVLRGADLQPAEWRLFDPPHTGAPTYVLYWHLVDGVPYDYGDRFNAVPDLVRWWRGALQQTLQGEREQYFIRLTSSVPFEELWSDPGFREVIRRLSALGLARPPAGSVRT